MAPGIITIIHAVLALLVVVELGLMARVVDATVTPWGSFTPSSFSFMLFNSVWSVLALVWLALTPLYLPKLSHKTVALAILAITSVFWFAGSIAMAAFIGVPKCRSNSLCQNTQAAVAFGFFIWVGFTALTTLESLAAFPRRGASADRVGPTPAAAV